MAEKTLPLNHALLALRADVETLMEIFESVALTDEHINQIRQTILETAGGQSQTDNALKERIRSLKHLQQEPDSFPFEGPARLERMCNYLQQLEPKVLELVADKTRFTSLRESLRELCRQLLREINLLYVLRTFNSEALKPLRVGYSVDFLSEFEDRLPDIEDRWEVLRRLKRDSATLGYVDLENGVVYRMSTHPSDRFWSYARITGAVVLGAVLFAVAKLLVERGISLGIGNLDANIMAPSWLNLLTIYAITGLGFVAHTVKKALEKGQRNPLLDEMLLWIHVKEMDFIKTAILLWIAFAGLLTFKAASGQPMPSVVEALFVGYTADSLGETVIQRYNPVVSETLTAFTAFFAEPAGQS